MRLILLFCLLLFPAAAHAEWLKASSAHFVVYADDSEKDIRRFSQQLESFHTAMAMVTGQKVETPSPSNRVTIFVVRSGREVRELYGEGGRYVGGFYVPRAGQSIAIVPRVKLKRGDPDLSMITLLHEYAHHFMNSTSSFPAPRWLSEGSAEFFASASFDTDGSVSLGRTAQHRAAELFLAKEIKAAELFEPDAGAPRKGGFDSFYGKSWLLYHYLAFSEDRHMQLANYLQLLIAGKSSHDAATEAFGDLDVLEKELDHYMNQRRLSMLTISASLIKIDPISVEVLSDGAAAMMPVRIRSRVGVTPEEAAALLVEARAVAAHYPGDPAVYSALAEAEYDAGNDAQAIAAADAALAADPGQVNAYVQKGYALFRMARDAVDAQAAYGRAREPFVALNRLENDHPLPLIYYYRSFVDQGVAPPELAVEGLEWAARLAPFDLGLKMAVAKLQIDELRLDAARNNLIPIAYNPHGGEFAATAREMLDKLDNKELP